MYVGITGPLAAGKGEIVRILKKHGFRHYGFGEMLRNELTSKNLPLTVANMAALANKLREQHGAGYLATVLLRQFEKDAPLHAVFESIRSPAELRVLRRLPGLTLISVDAPRERRFEWLRARGRGDEFASFEDFCAAEEKQLEGAAHEQQLLAVMDEADIRIVNVGTLEELQQQVEDELGL